ncbi:MAG TPA: M20/M25/M40 family metallo-hydrolase [Gemmatimonadaceae bacterium]|nr:M20/M25/M40 family metallo-hydrolase [Gemmatimonadaceae bacterium]
MRPEPDAIAAIVREGTTRSHVAEDLAYLSDVIGPRLTGSAAMRRANDWAATKFREYGADSAWIEPWKFGRAWERGPMTLTMLAPHRQQLEAASWAWAPGTDGPLAGDVVYVDATTAHDFAARFGGKLAGKWVMTSTPTPTLNPDGPALTARDSAAHADSLRAFYAPPATPAEQQFAATLVGALAGEKIAGYVRDGAKEHTLLTMSGSPARLLPYPYVVVPHETYTQFYRLVRAGETVRIEANIVNTLTRDSTTVYNTIAEIRGSERPDEVVLLGAHLDSWDLGSGTTDNATGSIAVLEAARILNASGVRPRRTIRFALFSGEEQGLYGSSRYAAAHAAELDRFQAVLVIDNGTGRITGVALQKRDELGDAWRSFFAPLGADLGPFAVRSAEKGGTDHLSFLRYGVPGFNFDQLSRGYDHTHHSQADTFDHAVIGDVRQAATVMAATAYQLANLPALLPRNASAQGSR